MGIGGIVKLIVAPFFLSVMFLLLAVTGAAGTDVSDRLYFIIASAAAASVGCFGIWIARGSRPPTDSPSGDDP